MNQFLLNKAATYVPTRYESVAVLSMESSSGTGPFDAVCGSTARDIFSSNESVSRTCGAFSSNVGVGG